jgi:hypothetical protein
MVWDAHAQEKLAKAADCSATWKHFAYCICKWWRRHIHLEFEVGASAEKGDSAEHASLIGTDYTGLERLNGSWHEWQSPSMIVCNPGCLCCESVRLKVGIVRKLSDVKEICASSSTFHLPGFDYPSSSKEILRVECQAIGSAVLLSNYLILPSLSVRFM